jgi:soluble lytic murein transglycosylase-like protein
MNPLIITLGLFILYILSKSNINGILSGGKIVNKGYKQVLYWRDIVSKSIKYFAPELPLNIVLGIIATESMGNPELPTGSSGEVGVMQITQKGLAWAGVPYTMNQIKTDQKKNIETGVKHLIKDWQYIGDLDTAIMCYNANRTMIKNVINGNGTEKEKAVYATGKEYLRKVQDNAKIVLSMLLNEGIDIPDNENYIPYEVY